MELFLQSKGIAESALYGMGRGDAANFNFRDGSGHEPKTIVEMVEAFNDIVVVDEFVVSDIEFVASGDAMGLIAISQSKELRISSW